MSWPGIAAQLAAQDGQHPEPGPGLPPEAQGAIQYASQARAQLHQHITGWLGGSECARADFAGAVAATVHGDGEPLWGMIVGAPAAAKTETIRMAGAVQNDALDEFTSAALLSFSKAKNPRPVGVLTRIPPKALITVADFSTILASSDKGLRDQLFADLRRVYDGQLARNLGNMPHGLFWQGRVTMLAASTPAIDDYASHSDKLGPRWLYYRGTDSTTALRQERAGKRISERQLQRNRAIARDLFGQMTCAAMRAYPHIALSDQAEAELGDIAVAVALLRSPVPRDGYGRREIIGLPVTEEPYRLASQVKTLTRGLIATGYREDNAVSMALRCAADTVPPVRIRVLWPLRAGAFLTHAAIGTISGVDRKVARRALEDLRALRITECPVEDTAMDIEDPASYAFKDGKGRLIPKRWRLAWTADTDQADRARLVWGLITRLSSPDAVPKMGDALSGSLGIEGITDSGNGMSAGGADPGGQAGSWD